MRNSRIQEQRLAEVTRRRIEALAPTLPAVAETPPQGPAPEGGSAVDKAPGRHARRPVPVGGRLAGWVADRLPATLQGRVHLGAAQLGLVALVVAVGLTVTSWWMVRAGGREETVAPPRPPAAGATPVVTDATSTAASPSEDPTVVVDVAGRVRRPGIAVLPAGSRVVDALEAAGGIRRGVDLTTLNLARVLVDGEQVLVGVDPPPGAAPAAAPTAGPVDLNSATVADLDALPGIGPVLAQRIVDRRTEHGRFASVEQLREVTGIGESKYADLAAEVAVL